MAETTANNERRSQAIPEKKWRRRQFLRGGIAWGATLGISSMAGYGVLETARRVSNVIDNTTSSDSESKFKATKVLLGETVIKKGLNLRRSPEVVDDNLVSWPHVVEINGVNIKNAEKFAIENALIVEGRNPANSSDKNGEWINVQGKIENPIGAEATVNLYMSLSNLTSSFIDRRNTMLVDLNKVEKDLGGKIGVVSIPPK